MTIVPKTGAAFLVLAALLPLAASCDAPGESAAGTDAPEVSRMVDSQVVDSVPLLELGDPNQEIGEFEGGGDQTLDLVADVEVLTGGRIAVVDQNAAIVLVYDSLGALLNTLGGPGDGPGEFRMPMDIRVADGDSVHVLDGRDNRVSIFGPDLDYVREADATDLSGTGTSAYNHHFVDRFWVAGPVTPARRAAAEKALRTHPYPVSRGGFRFVRAAADGRHWVRETAEAADSGHLWFVLDREGTATHALRTPERLDPIHIRGDTVWGRWRGELDVNYVRRYLLRAGSGRVALPSWMGGPADAPAPPMPDSVMAALRALIRNAATIQEIHYSEAMTYSPDLRGLLTERGFELGDGLHLDVLFANEGGWGTVLTMEGNSNMCALTYGRGAPPGFPGGRVVCGG